MNSIKNIKNFTIIAITLTVAVFAVIFIFFPPLPQWPSYHQFADTKKIGSIPNFFNVMSNAPISLVGVLGFFSLKKQWCKNNINTKERVVFLAAFLGVFLTGIGSAYYHWNPTNASLVWDRLPITMIFTSLLSLTLMERVNFKIGFRLFPLLLLFGFFSVLYWYWSELLGRGDLRLYIIIQFYSAILIIVMLIFFPKGYPRLKHYIWMLTFYTFVVIFEATDKLVYSMGELISGHTLKHIAAALAAYMIVCMLKES